MGIVIKDLEKKDEKKAIEFAIRGMHFDRYTEDPGELYLYGKYFFYMEMQKATQVLAAYEGDQMLGALMAQIEGERPVKCSFFKKIYVKVIDYFMRKGETKDASLYDEANALLYEQYAKKTKADGEICFLAADPSAQGKGIGSQLLAELEKREKGKQIHLYTDDNCTYQFYEHRGFQRRGEKVIKMKIHGKQIPLTCFLFSKVM